MNAFQVISSLLVPVLKAIANSLSPAIRDELTTFVKQLHDKATATPNPFDDLLTGLLAEVLGITL